jgi:hypothetical protein
MQDITKCKGDTCPQKETCYRFTSKPDTYRQSYFVKPPFTKKKKCEHYWRDVYTKQLRSVKERYEDKTNDY